MVKCRHRLLRHLAVVTAFPVAVFAGPKSVSADPVVVTASRDNEHGELVLQWPATTNFNTVVRDGRLYITFANPIEGSLRAAKRLQGLVDTPALENDNRTLVLRLSPKVTALTYTRGTATVVELARTTDVTPSQTAEKESPSATNGTTSNNLKAAAAASSASTSPAAVSTPTPPTEQHARVVMRAGQHPGFSRLVFDWGKKVGYQVERPSDDQAVIRFDQRADIDTRSLQRRGPPLIDSVSAKIDEAGGTQVTIQVTPGATIRHYADPARVVVDVVAPVETETPEKAATDQTAAAMPEPDAAANSKIANAETAALQSEPQPVTKTSPAAPAALPADQNGTPSKSQSAPVAPQSGSVPAASPSQASEPALRFAWDRPAAAAVFQRAGTLWIIFDAPSQQDLAKLRSVLGPAVHVEQQPRDTATILRLSPAPAGAPHLGRDGLVWIVSFGDAQDRATATIHPQPDPPQQPTRLLLPVAEPGAPLWVEDESIGDRLVVVPTIPLDSAVANTHQCPQFRILASSQGIVISPQIDRLRVRSLADGVEITAPDGLSLSPVSATDHAENRPLPLAEPTRLLDSRSWGEGPLRTFSRRRRILEREMENAPPGQREQVRLRAAQFFVGNGYAAEALGVLGRLAEEHPEIQSDPRFHLLRGAARLQLHRTAEAREDLAAAGDSDEARLWATAAGNMPPTPQNREVLAKGTAIAMSYPPAIRLPLLLSLAEEAIAQGLDAEAESLLQIARDQAQTPEEKGEVLYLDGRRLAASGETDQALGRWQEAAETDPRRTRARAELARVQLLYKQGKMSAEDAIKALDPLRFVWRGDETELAVDRALADMQIAAGDIGSGLRTLRQASTDFGNMPEAADIPRKMADTFESVFLGNNNLSALSALGIYNEFRELMPGGEKGNRIIDSLVDKMVSLDLLGEADTLLSKELSTASTPADRARLGERLAEIRNLDRQPKEALEALHASAAPDIPADLRQARDREQARALAALGRQDAALALLVGDDNTDSLELKAKILRDKGDWAGSADVLEKVLDRMEAAPAASLKPRQADDVLDLAVTLTLAKNDSQLTRLDRDYSKAMASTPMSDAFRLLSATVAPANTDPKGLQKLVNRALAFRQSLQTHPIAPESPSPETTPTTPQQPH